MGWFFKRANKKDQGRQPKIAADQGGYAFRRSRTLTGSTSAKVTPSAASRSQLKTPRLKAHELRQERTKILRMLGFLGVCMIILAFIIVNYVSTFTINFYEISSESSPSTNQYDDSLKDYFNERPIERFGFILNSDQLNTFMCQKHSELASFMALRQWYGGDVKFAATFRQPLLVWQTGDQKFYVDSQGIAFTSDYFKQSLVSVEDKSGIAPDSSNSVASQRFIRFLGQLVGAVNEGGKGKVTAIIIPSSTREIDLTLEGRGYPIKTHIDRDPLQQAEDILNALKYFDEKGEKPQYIDARVAGKAFYK